MRAVQVVWLALALLSGPALGDVCRAKLHGTTQRWRELDKVVAENPGPVSGGVFLYQRQSSLLSEMVRSQAEAAQTAGRARRFLVCETGFGAGHSAALFLESSPLVDVVTFSTMNKPFSVKAAKLLHQKYPGRYSYVQGDSCKTVPKFEGLCDFMHGSSLCLTDNIDLVGKSRCGAQLTSTAMYDLTDRSVYFGPRAQWTLLRDAGCIKHIRCYTEASLAVNRSFIFVHKGTNISHKFCSAVTTGRCTGVDATEIGLLVDPKFDGTSVPCKPLGVTIPDIELCKEHMVAVPEYGSSTLQLVTVVITSYSTTGFRKRWLQRTTQMYRKGVYRTIVDRVIVVWNNPDSPPPELPDGVLVLKMTTNSLNHRWTEVIPHVRTESVLNLDDDVFVSKPGIECLLTWRAKYPDRLVGPFVRVTKHGKYVIDELFGVQNVAHENQTAQSYEMVLPRILMLGKQHLEAYKSIPVATRGYVDTQEAHCDDIAMNLAAAAESHQPPFRTMLPRNSVVDYYATCWTDFKNDTGGLGLQKDRVKLRSECLTWLLGKYPAGTLKTSNAVGTCDLNGNRVPLQPNQGGDPVEWRKMIRPQDVARTCKET